MTNAITATAPQSARSLWVLGDRVTFMGKMDGGNLSVIELDVPPGSGTPPHSHASLEIFRVR